MPADTALPAVGIAPRNRRAPARLVARLLCTALCLWAVPSWADGIEIGKPVIIKKKNQRVEGTLTRIVPDTDTLTVITPKSGNRLVRLRDVRRILPTGETMLVTPAQADIPRHLTSNILRFEMLQGQSIEGVLLNGPSFEVEAGGRRQSFLLRVIASIEAGQVSSAPGLTIGSRVRSSVEGESIIGTVVGLNLYRPDDAIMVLTAGGEEVELPIRDLLRIQPAVVHPGARPPLPVGQTANQSDWRLYDITTVSGRAVQGRILTAPLFSIDTGKGIRKNLWNGLEVIEKQ
ncbi:hypothetical protein GMST_19990 [Geomonas silvestris]|uniref:Uncharacterized protein n=1 Tax=Geomonas silvestris TaxID=2740184 RepID=A0A6V8MIA9_9BACT|nr:hypothetical protein [Geomonas silvestris]GFO59674.1 hypothetical protein GMST_19990 [Geomonas silvestris]